MNCKIIMLYLYCIVLNGCIQTSNPNTREPLPEKEADCSYVLPAPYVLLYNAKYKRYVLKDTAKNCYLAAKHDVIMADKFGIRFKDSCEPKLIVANYLNQQADQISFRSFLDGCEILSGRIIP